MEHQKRNCISDEEFQGKPTNEQSEATKSETQNGSSKPNDPMITEVEGETPSLSKSEEKPQKQQFFFSLN